MLTRHWLWWHRDDADRTEVLVIFDVTADFEIVSASDAAGVDQDLTDDEADTLRHHFEAHYNGRLMHRAA